MSIVERLVDNHFGVKKGVLEIGGAPVDELVRDHGTLLFVYDSGVLHEKWQQLRKALPDRVEIYYSVKANPNRAILEAFLRKGCGLEIASGGEFAQALAAGCPAERVVFAGPGKSDTEIREFLVADGRELHIESVNEARRLVTLCEELGANASAAVRINPSSEVQGGAMRMGGKPAPFGVDEELVGAVVETLESSSRVTLSGVHIFAGTQILDVDVLAAQYRKCLELARGVSRMLKRPLSTVDFGGGLGIPYFEGDDDLDVAEYGKRVGELMADLDDDVFGDARLLVEPGRYLVGEAGVYLVRVLDIKESRGKKYVVVDGGMNHHLAASGNLGQVIKRNFPLAVVTRLGDSHRSKAEIAGPLCTPLDALGRNVDLSRDVGVGDIVGVFQSGAYARTASPLGFLSHVTPAEVLVSGGRSRVIRRRGTYEDLMHDLE